MYGTVDAGINSIKLGNRSALKVSEGAVTASQLGFRGSEDLGGGMKAVFLLEGGITLDTGEGNIAGPNFAFTRQAYMGLENTWGNITIGRQYTPTFILSARYDPFGANALMGTVNLWYIANDMPGYTAFTVRQNNSIQYSSPASIPWKLNLMYGAGESDLPSTSSGRMIDVSGGYQSGPLSVMLGRQERKSGSATAPVANPSTSTSQGIFANYSFGAARVGFNYGTAKSDAAGSPGVKYMGLGGTYAIGGAWTALAHYQRRDVENTANDQNAFSLGVNYALSQRSMLYGRMMQFNNKGDARAQLGGYTFTANSALAGEDGRSIMFGVRHSF